MTNQEVQVAMMKDEDYVEFLDQSLLVPHYLIHCYLYYEEFTPLISDSSFDQLARRLLDEWEEVKHFNKDLIDKEGLLSGGSYLEYPLRVQNSAKSLLK